MYEVLIFQKDSEGNAQLRASINGTELDIPAMLRTITIFDESHAHIMFNSIRKTGYYTRTGLVLSITARQLP